MNVRWGWDVKEFLQIIWVLIQKYGKTPQIIPFSIGFSIINHPFWGPTPIFWKHPYQVFLWTCSLSNNNGHLIQSTGPWTDVGVDPLLCRYLYLHAQHCRSGLYRNVRQVRTELPGQILLQCVFFANFFGAVSQIFHILASSPSDEQWPFSIVGWGENPNTFLPKLDDSWRTDWDWQGGGTTWNASLTSQWWGKGKEKKVHHQA